MKYGKVGNDFPLFLLTKHMEVFMEKISNIVRGSARVASVDMKSANPVRSGTPSFGGPVSESSVVRRGGMTTADRAVALHTEMNEAKKVLQGDRTVANLADQFFMSRVRRPEEQKTAGPGGELPAVGTPVSAPIDGSDLAMDAVAGPADETVDLKGYTPRGSYVDVRA